MTKLMAFTLASGLRPDGREHEHKPLHYTACGLDDVYLINGFTRERIDGEDAVTIEDMDGLWKAIGLALVTGRKALAPREVRFLREHMDLTQAELGAKLRVSDQTIARWEKNKNPMPGAVDALLRVLFLGSEAAPPEGHLVAEQLVKLLEDLRERDEPRRPAPINLVHRKRWERERVHAA
jgi:DNA-binding transcriptional regulator YiaG